jgi:peptide/nickel transport system substrate-binding protein
MPIDVAIDHGVWCRAMSRLSRDHVSRRQLLRGGAGALGAVGLLGFPAAAHAQGARKDTLTVALPSNPETIDPQQLRAVLTGSAMTLMVESLLVRDPQTMELKPLLALSCRSIDPRTWELRLRRGVRFHNGEEFDAESVKWSLERVLKTRLNTLGRLIWPRAVLADLRVQIVDSHTVRIVSTVPDVLLPNRLALESVAMMPPKALAGFKETYVTDRVIGTGPYRFVEFVVGDRLVMEANPDYWGPKPPTKRIVWQVIPDAATRVAALQRGVADVSVNVPVPLVPTVEADPALRVHSQLGSTTHILVLNARESPPLKHRAVRQALNHAIDRPAILKHLYGGHGQLLTSVVARQVTDAIDPGAYAYDPGRAKKLLAEAGYPNGFELTLWQATRRWSQAAEVAQTIAGYFEKVGVRTKLQTLEWAEYNRRFGAGLHKDACYYAFTNGTWDPSYLTERFLPTFPTHRYFDAEGDLRKLIEEHQRASDPGKRKELAATVQRALRDEAPWVFLWQLDEIFGLSRKVKGFSMRADHVLWLRDAWVEA